MNVRNLLRHVQVFSKATCPYCIQALRLLESEFPGVDMNVINLSTHKDANQIQSILGSMTGARTVPRVFVMGKSVGGCDDTVAAVRSGQLRKMLATHL